MDKSKLLKISPEEMEKLELVRLRKESFLMKANEQIRLLDTEIKKVTDKLQEDYKLGKKDQIAPDGTIKRIEEPVEPKK